MATLPLLFQDYQQGNVQGIGEITQDILSDAFKKH